MNSNFWKMLGTAALNAALQGAAAASQSGASPADVGKTAGIGALGGILQYLISHPAAPKFTTPVLKPTIPVE